MGAAQRRLFFRYQKLRFRTGAAFAGINFDWRSRLTVLNGAEDRTHLVGFAEPRVESLAQFLELPVGFVMHNTIDRVFSFRGAVIRGPFIAVGRDLPS